MIKYGFIDRVRESDWRLGVNSNAVKKIINKKGDYTDVIPKWESQIGLYGDTMACVTFSALDCIETAFKQQLSDYGLLDDFKDNLGDINFSDRYIAKLSGTTRSGNYFTEVGRAIRKYGLIKESEWNFPWKQRTPVFAWDDYYEEIHQDLIDRGKDFLNYFDINYELIPINQIDIKEQLKYGPLQISYSTKSPSENGVYQNNIAYHAPNHAVMLYNVDDNGIAEVLDHYERDGKGHTKFAANYQFGYWALQYYITPKEKSMVKLKDRNMYLLVEGNEQKLALAVDNDLMFFNHDTECMVNSNWKKPIALGISDWNSFHHINSKREVLDE